MERLNKEIEEWRLRYADVENRMEENHEEYISNYYY